MSDLNIRLLADPHVSQPATRRRFTAADKLRLLREVNQCAERGQLGAILRREAIYSSTLASFRRQRGMSKMFFTHASSLLSRVCLYLP